MTDFSKTASNTDREKIAEKIRALIAKSRDAAVGEAEAILYATKASELMAQYEISRDDVESIKSETWGKRSRPYAGGTVRRRVFHETAPTAMAVGKLCDCRCYYSGADLVFFGTKQDTEVAHYLVDLIRNASEVEFKRYLNSPERPQSVHGRTLRASFMNGFTARVCERLYAEAKAKEAVVKQASSTGTSLVVVKNQELSTRFAALGLKLTARQTTSTVRSSAAQAAGHRAGSRVSFNTGVGAGGAARIGGGS